jgi:hypothetical protein
LSNYFYDVLSPKQAPHYAQKIFQVETNLPLCIYEFPSSK